MMTVSVDLDRRADGCKLMVLETRFLKRASQRLTTDFGLPALTPASANYGIENPQTHREMRRHLKFWRQRGETSEKKRREQAEIRDFLFCPIFPHIFPYFGLGFLVL